MPSRLTNQRRFVPHLHAAPHLHPRPQEQSAHGHLPDGSRGGRARDQSRSGRARSRSRRLSPGSRGRRRHRISLANEEPRISRNAPPEAFTEPPDLPTLPGPPNRLPNIVSNAVVPSGSSSSGRVGFAGADKYQVDAATDLRRDSDVSEITSADDDTGIASAKGWGTPPRRPTRARATAPSHIRCPYLDLGRRWRPPRWARPRLDASDRPVGPSVQPR